MFGEDRRRHSAHAARHGRDGVNDRLRSIRIDVTHQLASGLVPINANINDRLALSNRIHVNRTRASNGGNHNVGSTALGSKVVCMRMARRHGRIARRKHGGNGTANHQRPTNDRDLGPIQLNAVMIQQSKHGFGCAGGKTLAAPRKRGEQRSRRHGVNVLGRIECRGNRVLVKAGGQRAEHQAAMNSGVGIDVLDDRQQLVLRNIGGKQNAASFNANLLAAPERTALVG